MLFALYSLMKKYKSTCCYCGVGCGVDVTLKRDKVSVNGDASHPSNQGMLCSKGLNLHQMVNDTSDRLLYPMMRMSKGYNLERVSWNSAMNRVTKVFKSIIDRFGPDSVGFYVSGQCLTEEYYLVNKLTKGFLQTNNIDTNSRLCMSSAVVGYKKTLGEDSVPITYEDIELADCFLIAGANPAWCHPILFQRIDKVKELNPNAKVIVVDPRRTESCEIADIHVQLNPGTDTTFFNAVARVLIESDQIDHQFVKKH